MRLLFELLLAGALVVVAWDKSYHELVGEAVPMLAKQPSAPPARAAGERSRTIGTSIARRSSASSTDRDRCADSCFTLADD